MKISIKGALTGSFATLLVLSLAQGMVGLIKLDAISNRTAELLDTTIPSMNEANAINVLERFPFSLSQGGGVHAGVVG